MEHAEAIDHEGLAEGLRALAYPLRLELLAQLGSPVTLSEVRIAARRGGSGEAPSRSAAMTTVAEHLKQLVEAGVVTTGTAMSGGRELTTYAVNPTRLYALTEELRRVTRRHGGRGLGASETGTLAPGASGAAPSGPRVVVVHGAYEGRSFPLRGDGPWVVGRRKDATVALDYDPFVSVENSRIERTSAGFELVDLPENKNGTSVHWVPLPRGGRRMLQQGDILGVGRSLLVFYAT